jgi:hypothetical protein
MTVEGARDDLAGTLSAVYRRRQSDSSRRAVVDQLRRTIENDLRSQMTARAQ